jgi:hypothetical protein
LPYPVRLEQLPGLRWLRDSPESMRIPTPIATPRACRPPGGTVRCRSQVLTGASDRAAHGSSAHPDPLASAWCAWRTRGAYCIRLSGARLVSCLRRRGETEAVAVPFLHCRPPERGQGACERCSSIF